MSLLPAILSILLALVLLGFGIVLIFGHLVRGCLPVLVLTSGNLEGPAGGIVARGTQNA